MAKNNVAKKRGRPSATPTSPSTAEENIEIDALVSIIEGDSEESDKVAQLESVIKRYNKQLENNLKGYLKAEILSLKTEIMNLQHENEVLKTENENYKKQSDINKKNTEMMKEEFTNFRTKISKMEESHAKVVEYCEERTNRQLRKTIVFKGIPEKPPGENGRNEERWEETAELLAQHIADICEDTSISVAKDMVERCHRSKPSPRYKGDKSGPRPIIAAFLDWRDSESVKEQFRLNNINTDSVISCEQKYGPRTTVRRNMALKERRRLKLAGEISSGYVKFPAILMVKNSNDTNYRKMKDFSNEPVHFI